MKGTLCHGRIECERAIQQLSRTLKLGAAAGSSSNAIYPTMINKQEEEEETTTQNI